MRSCLRHVPRFFACLVTLWLWQAPAGGGEYFTFVQVSDTQLGFGASGYAQDVANFELAVEQINALGPDFVVICGDLVNDSGDSQAWIDFERIMAGLTMPCYCVAGNHDVWNVPTSQSLQNYRDLIGQDYYAFEHKGLTFIVVNTQLWKSPLAGETEAQDLWFAAALGTASGKGNPIVVAGHHPLYLTSPDEADEYYNLPLAKRTELLGLFETHGVIAYLSGHKHDNVVNDYMGIQLVTTASTSKNAWNTDLGGMAPFGYRVWHVGGTDRLAHEYVELANPVQADADTDGLPDAAEAVLGTDPADPDTDGDGMPDGWEVTGGLEPNDPADADIDADGDTYTNLEEYEGGSDPNDAGSVPSKAGFREGVGCGAGGAAGALALAAACLLAVAARSRPRR